MSRESTVHQAKHIQLPKVKNIKGNLTSVEGFSDLLPFGIKRVYYLYDIPGGEERGAHGHKALHQLIVAASGSFEVKIHDGKEERIFSLNRPYEGLLLVPGLWREITNFSSGSVCLVLASMSYDETDYIRDYSEFLSYKS